MNFPLNEEAIKREAMKRCILKEHSLRDIFELGVQTGIRASQAFIDQMIKHIKETTK